jgi:hypothetical protein
MYLNLTEGERESVICAIYQYLAKLKADGKEQTDIYLQLQGILDRLDQEV